MQTHNPPRQTETDPGTLFFCREKRYENIVLYIFWDPRAVVSYLDDNVPPVIDFLVPRGGFYQKTGGQWIYLVDEAGKFATKRKIRLGRQNTQMFEVLEGLKPGERVVTSSYDSFGDIDKLVLKN